MECHYQRPCEEGNPPHEEVSVIYLLDASTLLPPRDEFLDEYKKLGRPESADKETLPRQLCLLSQTRGYAKNKYRTMQISLDGVLDYDRSDKYETTFEVSLLGEMFIEMLQRDFAAIILATLQLAVPYKTAERREERRKLREERKAKRAESKFSDKMDTDTKDKEDKKKEGDKMDVEKDEAKEEKDAKEEDEEEDEEAKAERERKEKEEKEKREKEIEEEKERQRQKQKDEEKREAKEKERDEKATAPLTEGYDLEADEEVLKGLSKEDIKATFEFFDKSSIGYINCKDLQSILLASITSFPISNRYAHSLVMDCSDSNGSPRVSYSHLVDLLDI